MSKKNSGQIDIFNHMIFKKLIPKNHLLVKIDSVIDFSFVYEKVKDKYSNIGKGSKDPVMMIKILLLEHLYNLSDVEIASRINTDIAFLWFLGLGIDDEVPDDTTISYFRVKRLDEEDFDAFFNEIVMLCIEKDIVKSRRYIFDTTDVAANVNYPSDKRFKVERRFATMVRNHGLRRYRYLRLKGAKIHITLANMACNIVRMVNLIYPPGIALSKI
jgi:transposase